LTRVASPVSLAAIGPDGSLAFYLALGMVATVNPCGFAMLPAYLSYFLGTDRPGADGGDGVVGLTRAIRVAIAVSAGFLAVFALAGLVVELSSVPVYEYMPWVSLVLGVGLVVLGIAMVAGYTPLVDLPKLERGGRERTTRSMFVFGVSYAIASIGCTLPAFLVAVSGTINRESVADGLVVFGIYALGMILVLLALTVAIALARTSIVRFLRSSRAYIGRVSGGLVALAGAYVAYYGWLELRLRDDGPVPQSSITDTVTGWSYDVQRWISDTGPVRIAVTLAMFLGVLAATLVVLANRRSAAEGTTAVEGATDAQGASRSTRQPVGSEGSGR
jgi:cytochrome c-type biogenesis protein